MTTNHTHTHTYIYTHTPHENLAAERSPVKIYVTQVRSGGRAFSFYVTDFIDTQNHEDGKSAGGTVSSKILTLCVSESVFMIILYTKNECSGFNV